MYNDYNQEYDVLKSKILERLSGEIVQSDENIISLYDLNQILKLHYNKYKCLYELPNETRKLNKKLIYSNLLVKRIPKIKNMNIIFENNVPFLKINFESENNENEYVIYGLYNGSIYINDYYKSRKNNINNFEIKLFDFTNLNSKEILKYLYLIEEFLLEYNDMRIKLAYSKKFSYFDDGFITSYVCCNPNLNNFHLTNKKDLNIAINKRSLVEGDLIEYLEFYKKDVEKRTAIDLNKMPSYIKNVIDHYYKNNKVFEKTLTKRNK